MNKLVFVERKDGDLIIHVENETSTRIYGKITTSVNDPLLMQVAEIKGICINDLVQEIKNLEEKESKKKEYMKLTNLADYMQKGREKHLRREQNFGKVDLGNDPDDLIELLLYKTTSVDDLEEICKKKANEILKQPAEEIKNQQSQNHQTAKAI